MLYLNYGNLDSEQYLEFYNFMLEGSLIQKNVDSGGILNVIALLFIFKSNMANLKKQLNLTEILLLLDIEKYGYILQESNINIDNIIRYAISA